MLLNVRSISVSVSVIFFFTLGFVGWLSDLSTYVCCKRALIGAVISYVLISWIIRLINAILMDAIIESQVNQQKESESVGRNSGIS